MAVTELALIHLNPSSGWPTDPYVRSSLLKAKKAMESFTNRRFYFYNQVEDPSYIYIIGSWPSLSQHTNEWIPSKEELLKDKLEVDWMFHLGIDQDKDDSVSSEMIPFSGPALAIARHFVDSTNKTKFADTFDANQQQLANFVAQHTIRADWRIDLGPERNEEFVLFLSGLDHVEQHSVFLDGCREYAQIKKTVSDVDVKHATKLDLD
ncbi:hypothetical protein V1522DRAFT_233580 [Lipomyces starkeyi]